MQAPSRVNILLGVGISAVNMAILLKTIEGAKLCRVEKFFI